VVQGRDLGSEGVEGFAFVFFGDCFGGVGLDLELDLNSDLGLGLGLGSDLDLNLDLDLVLGNAEDMA
jgi:hypothetical protein